MHRVLIQLDKIFIKKTDMKNITNKELQRMRELMGGKKPINENISLSNVELKKKAPNGKVYGVSKENKKYFIKESIDGVNFDFIGGVANKIKNQYNSFEEAVRRLNLMVEDTDVLTPDIIEEKKFVIKTKKKKSKETEEPSFNFDNKGGEEFDFGGEEKETEEPSFGFGGEEESGEKGEDELDFGGEAEDTELEDTEETDEDLDLEDDGEDSIKTIQKMTGKLGQKLRDTEDVSSDMSKWVAKSVLSALNLEDMDSEDKKDLIRTIKKKKDEGSDEEFDFMNDDYSEHQYRISNDTLKELLDAHDEDDFIKDEEDMVDWNNLSDEEKSNIVNNPGDMEKPMMDWDEEREYDYEDACSHCGGLGHDDMTGEECEWCMGTGVENMEDYMQGEDDMYGPGDDEVESGEQILSDDEDNCSYCSDKKMPYNEYDNEMTGYPGMEEDWMSDEEDFMSRYAKNVKRAHGRKLEQHELSNYVEKVKNKLGGSDNVSVDDDKVVGDFGYVQVTTTGYKVHKEGQKFSKSFAFNELGKLHDYVREGNEDYMDNPYMMPQPAPARPETRPETPVKPGKPDTDKPSPSKRPFTPPPHITPGEEPNPKAKYGEEEYGPTEGMDYMEDDSMEMCHACEGRGHEKGGIGFGRTPKVCITCAGSGQIPRMETDGEVDEPYVDSTNPMGYQEKPSSTLPKGMKYKFQYKEKFNFPFNMGENSKSNKKTIKKGLNEGYIEINGKTVRTYTQNGDTSYNVTYDDGTKDIIYVNNDGWDEINKLHGNAVGDDTYRRKFIKEDHINTKMASYEQEMAYEDVESMARQHGMDVEFCHKDKSKDPEEQTVYLDLMKKGKAVAKVRINSAGQIEMGDMKGKAFKGEPVDSHSDFDEVLGEKNIKMPMNPAPAPSKPQTRPETPVKPGRPDTDKPSPSKRPFTPPPHITPGEEPNPKARGNRR